MKISESVLREDAEDLLVDLHLNSDTINKIIDLDNLPEDDSSAYSDVQIDIEDNDADSLAGISFDSDIPDAEVPDVDDFPSDKDLRMSEREQDAAMGDDVNDSTDEDDDEAVADELIDQNTPLWVKEIEDDDAAQEVEDVTDEQLDEASNIDEFLDLLHKRALFTEHYTNL